MTGREAQSVGGNYKSYPVNRITHEDRAEGEKQRVFFENYNIFRSHRCRVCYTRGARSRRHAGCAEGWGVSVCGGGLMKTTSLIATKIMA